MPFKNSISGIGRHMGPPTAPAGRRADLQLDRSAATVASSPSVSGGGMHGQASFWFYANAVHSRSLLLVLALLWFYKTLSFLSRWGGGGGKGQVL
jgi:hypothetical protein